MPLVAQDIVRCRRTGRGQDAATFGAHTSPSASAPCFQPLVMSHVRSKDDQRCFEEVPYDPRLLMLFFGEEIGMTEP